MEIVFGSRQELPLGRRNFFCSMIRTLCSHAESTRHIEDSQSLSFAKRPGESRRPDPTEGDGGRQLKHTGNTRSNILVTRGRATSLCV